MQLIINHNLKLKIAEELDAVELYDLLDSNRKFLSEWLPNVEFEKSPIKSAEDYGNIIKEDLEIFKENKSGLFLVIAEYKIG